MSFGSDINRFQKKFSKATEDTVRGIKLELFNSVILDTPVDTGRARGNWQTSVSSPASGTTEELDPSGSKAIAEVSMNVGTAEDVSYLTNNLPYIEALEYGYSNKSPEGMVRKNVARIQRIVAKEARKHRI